MFNSQKNEVKMKILDKLKNKYIIWKVRRELSKLPPKELIQAATSYMITSIVANHILEIVTKMDKPKKKKKLIKSKSL